MVAGVEAAVEDLNTVKRGERGRYCRAESVRRYLSGGVISVMLFTAYPLSASPESALRVIFRPFAIFQTVVMVGTDSPLSILLIIALLIPVSSDTSLRFKLRLSLIAFRRSPSAEKIIHWYTS